MELYELFELLNMICTKIIYVCAVIYLFGKLRTFIKYLHNKMLNIPSDPRDDLIDKLKLDLYKKDMDIIVLRRELELISSKK